jgi:hypothetical protein
MINLILLLTTLFIPMTADFSYAAQIRVFVAVIEDVRAQNSAEMKQTLQTLLASRLNGDRIVVVGNVTEADAVVSTTYVTIGKVFSVDAISKTPAGKTISRAYVQGESENDLIPAMGKLADKLSTDLIKMLPDGLSDATPHLAPPSKAVSPSGIISDKSVKPAPVGDFIKPHEQEQNSAAGWLSDRLIGAPNLMTTGLTMPDGSREIFLAEGQRLAYYRQGINMKLVAETEFSSSEKIISLDTIAGSDRYLDIFVTILRAGELTSQVWQVKGDKLVLIAEKLPFYFRCASLFGGPKKLYAQSMGRNDDYYGDVFEVARNGSAITLKSPIKMPRFGNIYNFNQFHDNNGKNLSVIINPDGYLIVFDQQLNEIWRSNDKFGGSELFFLKEDDVNMRLTGDRYRWVFMNQRIQISSKGEILIGKNDGFWVLGNARSYKRGSVYCLTWNGSSLEEKWRTRDTQNYMPDYYFDESRNELLMLQTVQRTGIASRGASSLTIKKIE